MAEEKGVANFYSMPFAGGERTQVTKYEGADIHRPDMAWDRKTVVFERVGQLYRTDITAPAEKPTPIPLVVQSAVRKIPVTCEEVSVASSDGSVPPICRRVDSGDFAFPVPEGMTFALTDVLTNRNALILPGSSFFLSIRSSGGGFRINFSGDQALSPSKHFVTPMVFVREGDSLLVSNGDVTATGARVDVFLSGYLIDEALVGY